MSHLFSALSVRGVNFPNRAWVSPMCQYSAIDGVVGEWHRIHHGAFATGGAGLIMAEATGVVADGRISVACPGLWRDDQAEAWAPIVDFAHRHGSRMGIQLSHAGRKGSTLAPWADHTTASAVEGGWETVGPSAVPFEGYPHPRALEREEITALPLAFAQAARRAVGIGFDVVEIHAAHGYLLHQFLSPLSNHRVDVYGGGFENRARLVLEVVRAVREAIGDEVALFVRVSATDWVPGGWEVDDTVRLAPLLVAAGADLIDVSSGGNVATASIPVGPGYQVDFAARVRATGVATSAVGLITEPAQAEGILERGEADAVMLARACLRNPRWPLAAAEALGVLIPWPSPFERARTLRG